MTPPRDGNWLPITVALGAISGLAAVYVVAVQTHVGQIIDTRAMLAVARALAGATWTEGLLLLISPVTAVLAAGSVAAITGALRGTRPAAVGLVTTVGTAIVAEILKRVLIRPQLLDNAANSLPSGHVAAGHQRERRTPQ